MAFDLRWKVVLGLEVHDPPVGQVTLVEFRARVQLHEKMEEAFGRFVDGLLEAGVISADGVQLVDSSGLWDRGAVQDTYNLIQPDRERGSQAPGGDGQAAEPDPRRDGRGVGPGADGAAGEREPEGPSEDRKPRCPPLRPERDASRSRTSRSTWRGFSKRHGRPRAPNGSRSSCPADGWSNRQSHD